MLGMRLLRRESSVSDAERSSEPESAREVADRARQRGATAHVLDGAELVTKRHALDGIAAVLAFPEWSGRNLDALHDCLTDLSWLDEGEHVLVWSGHQALAEHDPKGYRRLTETLLDATSAPMCRRTLTVAFTRD